MSNNMAQPIGESRGKVLVIDDDHDFIEYIKIILESHNYQVLTAENAEEGLALARHNKPDIVLVDIMMSYVLDGLTVMRELRSSPQLKKLPIIAISAIISADEKGLLPAGQELEYDAFMSKPIEPKALLQKIAELIVSS